MEAVRDELDWLASVYEHGKGATFILGGHILFCAIRFKGTGTTKGPHKWLLSFWITFFGGFGGGLVTALLIGRPDIAPILALIDPRLLPMILIIWYTVQYSFIGTFITNSWTVRAVSRACSTFSRASLICARTELASTLFPGSYCAHLLLGTLGGSGGKLITDLILHSIGELKRPGELSSPTFTLRSGLFSAALYLTSVHLLPDDMALLAQQGRALVITILMVHAISSELLGLPLEFTAPMASIFHTISGIPAYSPALAVAENGSSDKKQQ